jgi:Zn-finger nucleic acid-binding protein
MKCPRDGKVLVFVDTGMNTRDRCSACEGVLIDRTELAGVLGKVHGRSVELAAERVAQLPHSSLACPRDGSKLHRLDYQGIEVDLCSQCSSLWLDGGELDKIRAAAKPRFKPAVAAGAVLAGVTVAAAAEETSIISAVGEVARDVAVEGGIEVVFEFAAEAIGALLS